MSHNTEHQQVATEFSSGGGQPYVPTAQCSSLNQNEPKKKTKPSTYKHFEATPDMFASVHNFDGSSGLAPQLQPLQAAALVVPGVLAPRMINGTRLCGAHPHFITQPREECEGSSHADLSQY